MPLLADYTITEMLQETEGAALYRARRNSDQHQVLLKRPLGGDRLRPSELARFRHECDIARGLDLPTVLKFEDCDAWSDRPVLVLEDFGGVSLDRRLTGPLPVGRFLRLGIGMARALANLHARGITHRDLTPRSFLVALDDADVKVTGFGLASHLTREQPSAGDPHLLEGALPYMSPEQTGRMNRVVDYRSDLYSLGVIFYEMLTGALPFQAKDPLEWVHCHVARLQQAPRQRVPGIPGPLSDIVGKLMAKMADDRYQSAGGLEADLEACLAQWEAAGRVEPFLLAALDVSERFVVPQRLYGREDEVEQLVRAFEGVARTGTPATVLISGYSGIGKTTLVQELYRPIVRARGYFISGKFDQYRGSIPYGIISQAFGGLMRQLLGESDEQIARWKARFQEALGINARLIVDVVPELALIIGPQAPVPEIGLAEAEQRFHLVFRQFLGVITRPEHPVALFLDDLQWMDAASIKLIEHIAGHPDSRHLLLIGAYRSNEVTPEHPLQRTLDQLRTSGAVVESMDLGPLSFADQRQLIADSTHAPLADVEPLALLVSGKTDGNPFFVIQFLLALEQDGLVAFDRRARVWRWDLRAIEARGFTDNVADLMVSRIDRLPRDAKEAVKAAAAIGDRIDAAILALVIGSREEEAHDLLSPAVSEGLVARQDGTYSFLHDRIRQAAYTLVEDGKRAALHLRIGRLLFSSAPPERLPERVFDIVDQLNRGTSLFASEDEKIRAATLDLLAARRARASSAYLSAVAYASAGLDLLAGEATRRAQHQLAFALELERASCDYLGGHFEEAEERLSDLLGQARTRTERAAATVVLMNLHTNQVRPDRAAATAIDCLRDFGIELEARPTQERIEQAIAETLEELGGREVEDLIDLPRMTDPDELAAMDVLTALYAPALQMDNRLLCLVASRAVSLSVRRGNSDAASTAYVYFGLVLGALLERHREAHRFGQLGYDLVERRGLVSNKGLVLTCFEGIIRPWTDPIRDTVPGIERAFAAAMQTGSTTFACYAQHHLVSAKIIAGDPLEEADRATEAALAFARRARFGLVEAVITSQQRFIRDMRGLTESFSSFDDPGFRQADFEEALLARPATMSLPACLYFIWKTQARFLSGDNDEALRAAARAEALLWSVPSFQEVPDLHFYAALALAAAPPADDEDERRRNAERLRRHEERLRTWAESASANLTHKHRLVAAEIAAASGRNDQAMELYEEAIRLARENGFVQNEALGYELASRFFRRRGFEIMSDAYLREARSRYARWGAEGKVRQLDLRHPHLRERNEARRELASQEQVDVISVAKVSQAISQEVVLPALLKRMLRLLVEQAGAEKGSLLLARNGRLWLAATAEEEAAEVRLEPNLPVSGDSPLPLSILNYVVRTGETVSLEDAARRGRYIEDPYVIRHRPKSVLCLPLIRQSTPLGVLYLENNLSTHAFAANRLLVLQLLAGQAAIALENAQLYADLQRQQAATQASQAQLQAIVDTSGAVIFLKDTQGRYLLVNRRYEEIFHLERGWILGKTDYDVLGREVADTVRANDQKVLQAGRPLEWEEEIPHEGSLHTYIALKFPLRDAAGTTYAVCGISTDITARKHGEDSLRQAVRMRDEFLSVASHELRTPLASLMLSLEIIRRASRSDPRLERAVASAWQGGERLQRLFEELLDVSRIDAERMTLDCADVDLDALVRRVVARFRPDIERARCEVVVYGRALHGRWDRSRLDQVLANLLANALKFGPGHPVEITIEQEGDRALLSVRDHGIGIEPAQQRTIFDRFQRAVSERHYGGLGLGLYICRRIVEAHGGTIRADSQPGAGATFTVELPLDPRAASDRAT